MRSNGCGFEAFRNTSFGGLLGDPAGPLQLSSVGWRERAINTLKPGDTVALLGTMGENTRDEEQNRLLGLMEPTAERVSAVDYLKPERPT
jgi:hypothetical protein